MLPTSTFNGSSSSNSNFSNKQHRNYIDSSVWICFRFAEILPLQTILEWRNIFIFSVDSMLYSCMQCFVLPPWGRVFFKMFILFMAMPCTIARVRVWVCVSLCAWMSAGCQFLRLVSFEYVENVNNFNIRWIFIFAFIPTIVPSSMAAAIANKKKPSNFLLYAILSIFVSNISEKGKNCKSI